MRVDDSRFRRSRGLPVGRAAIALVAAFALLQVVSLGIRSDPSRAAPPNWQETGLTTLSGLDALGKTQGIATDGRRMYFSWNVGLQSTDLGFGQVFAENLFQAIPSDLSDLGLNHIGDIDYHDGVLYAPIEDGNTEMRPHIVEYDPGSLEPTGTRHLLDRTVLPNGVPWVAIDGPKRLAYTANWSNTDALNIHRLSDFSVIRRVRLSRTLERIQGAEIHRGLLYASRDNGTAKSIEAIDPTTGEVTTVLDRNLDANREAEGITILTNRQGTTMLATDISRSGPLDMNIRAYRIDGDTVPPSLVRTDPAGRSTVRSGRRLAIGTSTTERVEVRFEWALCKDSRRNRCARTVTRSRGTLAGVPSGSGRLEIPTRLRSGRPLPAGLYRLRLTPCDVADALGRTIEQVVRIAGRP